MVNQAYYQELLEASGQEGCPVCRMERTAVEKALRALFFELTNDVELRRQLRTSFGFCGEHAKLPLEHGKGDALGVSIIYHDVITNILRNLADPPEEGTAGGRWTGLGRQRRGGLDEQVRAAVKALSAHQGCMLCKVEDETRQAAIKVVGEVVEEEAFQRVLEKSEGLCLQHLRLALEAVKNVEAYRALVSISRRQLGALNEELREFIRKNDYRFRDEGFGSEGDAWKRALPKINSGGSKG